MIAPILALCRNLREVSAHHYLRSAIVERWDADDTRGYTKLLNASAVIFNREMLSMPTWLDAARMLGVPRYYFMDENVVTMRDQPEYHTHTFHQYSSTELCASIADFSGVFVSSQTLASYVRDSGIHQNVSVLSPIATQLPLAPAASTLDGLGYSASRVIRVAFFSTPIRQGLFATYVLPALRNLAHDFNIELVAFGCASGSLDDETSPLRVRTPKWNMNYESALGELKDWNPEIILQPEIITDSTPYKMPTMLITAAHVGAALIASKVPPYIALALDVHQPVMLATNTVQSWTESIRLSLQSPSLRYRCAQAAIDWVGENWPSEQNLATLSKLLQLHPAPSDATKGERAKRYFPTMTASFERARSLTHSQLETVKAQTAQVEQSIRDLDELRAALLDSQRMIALEAVPQALSVE